MLQLEAGKIRLKVPLPRRLLAIDTILCVVTELQFFGPKRIPLGSAGAGGLTYNYMGFEIPPQKMVTKEGQEESIASTQLFRTHLIWVRIQEDARITMLNYLKYRQTR